MKRLLSVLAALTVLAVLTTSHGNSAAQPPAGKKQLICHNADSTGAHIIEVSVHAVPAHLRNHGDCIINSTNRDLIGQPCDPTDANHNDICDVQP
jgi:hypothetical protein